MQFKNFISNEPITDSLEDYVSNWCEKHDSYQIAIGTDSHIKKHGKTVFVTTIIMFHPNNKGCHVIYWKNAVNKRYKNLFDKLWTELTYTKTVAEILDNHKGIDVEIHVDINPDDDEGSYIAYPSAVGMFKGMGYNVCAKPNAPAASCAGDYLVNKERKKYRKL